MNGFSNAEIINLRLSNQQISSTTFSKAEELVRCLVAMQAQEYQYAKWAIGLRLPHLSDNDVEQDFNEGKILRIHVLRPTWHFVLPADIRWMLALTAPRVNAVNAYMNRKMELDAQTFRLTNNILEKELRDGKQLTRDKLIKAFARKKIWTDTVRLSCILMHAELDALICSGPRKGNQFTYALLEERAVPSQSKTEDEALFELCQRYFKSRGPATRKDFSTWSGLSMTQVNKALSMNQSAIQKRQFNEEEYYFYPPEIEIKIPKRSWLLPVYDEYVMGYQNRSAISGNLTERASLIFSNLIITGGKVSGRWKRSMHKKRIKLEYELYDSAKTIAGFKKAFAGYARFAGLPLDPEQVV